MVVCVATTKMGEFMSRLSYECEPVRVSVTANPSTNVISQDRETYPGILREVPCEGGDKESSPYNHEKPEACHSRYLSQVWH